MLPQNTSRIKWQLFLVGLFFIIKQSEARAVNVSNTWTMPQEGLNVFYRFFRDRISWFEADAVCQFHHANLVTVDNSFQFDATRDLLRELDVNDIVWIGLMRPQSSDRFMWSSNSRPLVADTGYWAESLPLMDAPLCAVIDPIRDYRWHALRCGGPETASFLCEMPVPGWADACNLKDMPNLTLQYMADTASIELIRNCQEEGLLRTMCRGKQDRERALQDLVCPRERLEAQRINDITNSHFKSLQIINSIPSDNNENNDIELLPMDVNYGSHFPEELQTEKNTVQRLIEQFNVDELMQADEPSNMETVSSFYKIPGLIPKPVKKSAKKALESPKKDILKQKSNGMTVVRLQKEQKRLPVEMDEMMMGDQPIQGEQEMPEPFLNEEVSNEILEHLPHIKKTNIHREDSLEKLESMKKSIQNPKEKEEKKLPSMNVPALAATVTTISNTPVVSSTSTIEMTSTTTTADKKDKILKVSVDNTHHATHTVSDSNSDHSVTTISSAPIGHPIHPQKPRGSGISEESEHSRTKEATDNSHFIPPMLMVKSHYVPPANKHGHDHQLHHQQHQQQLKHEEQQLNFQTTTTKPEHIGTSQKIPMQKTTLKALDTSLSSTEEVKGIAFNNHGEHKVALIPKTEADSTIKPTTEQPATEIRFTEHLHNEEVETTTTAKPLHSVASPSKFTKKAENSQEINKNYAKREKDKDEKQVLTTPQTSHTDSESIQAATSAATTETSSKSTQILYDSPTIESSTAKEIADATTIKVMTPTQQQKVLSIEEKLKTIRNEKHKQVLPTTNTTPGKLAVPQSAEVLTTSTTVSQSVTQQTPTSKQTETVKLIQNLQQIEKELTTVANPQEANKNKTVVKTTEILQTSTTVGKEQQEGEESEQRVTEDGAVTTSVPLLTTTKSGSLSASTTVKSITTTVPQNEVKSTATSFSSASTTISATPPSTAPPTKTTTAGENNKYTTTTTASTSKRFATSTLTAIITTTADEVATEPAAAAPAAAAASASASATVTATARPETSTRKPSATKTTRNFLKVTTEMPFKPNRRRTLTKPETVSYMKKILG